MEICKEIEDKLNILFVALITAFIILFWFFVIPSA
jgi:hypothetical protein